MWAFERRYASWTSGSPSVPHGSTLISMPAASIPSRRLRPSSNFGRMCFCSFQSVMGMCSPFVLMSAASARSSSGAISGNSSAPGWIGRRSRQDFMCVAPKLAASAATGYTHRLARLCVAPYARAAAFPVAARFFSDLLGRQLSRAARALPAISALACRDLALHCLRPTGELAANLDEAQFLSQRVDRPPLVLVAENKIRQRASAANQQWSAAFGPRPCLYPRHDRPPVMANLLFHM